MDKESDRQRVLIQITQNLATRIRNSHAFNLPTFYLPREDDVPCTIPNAIEDVCKEIDKVWREGHCWVSRHQREQCLASELRNAWILVRARVAALGLNTSIYGPGSEY